MNHLPRGDVVQDHGGRVAIGDAIGDRKKVLGLAYKKFRESPVHRKRRHTMAHFETGDTSADRFHYTGDLITGHERYFRRVPILSGQHDQVCRAHSGSAHPHAQLPWAGRLHRQLNNLESLRSALLRQHHCAICCRHVVNDGVSRCGSPCVVQMPDKAKDTMHRSRNGGGAVRADMAHHLFEEQGSSRSSSIPEANMASLARGCFPCTWILRNLSWVWRLGRSSCWSAR